MTRPDAPIFDRLERAYAGSAIQGWYKAELGDYPAVRQAVWVMSLYNRNRQNQALTNAEYMVVADNTFLGSLAYNFILAGLLLADPGRTEICHTSLIGNAKLVFAEAEMRHAPGNIGRNLLVEYLFEYDEVNREVLRLTEASEYPFELHRTVAGLATMYALLHEIGHFYFRDPAFASPAKERVLDWFEGSTGPAAATDELREEAFCDLFASANTILEFEKQGFDVEFLKRLVRWTRASIFLAYIAEDRVAASYAGRQMPEDLSGHALAVRHTCVNALIDQELAGRLAPVGKAEYQLPFDAPDTLLFQAFSVASTYETRNGGIRRMSGLMVDAMASGRADPFEHVLENFFQVWRLEDGKPSFDLD